MSTDNPVRVVPLADIRANPVALRQVNRDGEKYIGIRETIGDPSIGMINPISVRERSENVDGKDIVYYEIVDGLHRYTAATELGLATVQVSVKDYNETEVLMAQIIGNFMKAETKPVEYTKGLQRVLAANPTWTMTDFANKLKVSPVWLNGRFGLLKLEENIQAIVDEGNMTVSNAVALSKLPHDEQLNYIDQAMTQNAAEFGPTVAKRLEEIKEAESKGKKPEEAKFVAVAKIRSKSEVEDELKSRAALSALVAPLSKKDEVIAAVLNWVLSLDAPTLATKEAQYNEKKKRLAEEQAKRKADRATKREKEAAEAAAKARSEAAAVTGKA